MRFTHKDLDTLEPKVLKPVPQPFNSDTPGPLATEYDRRFRKQYTALKVPRKPAVMEWFEEDELAKSIYEIMQAEMDLEATKRNLALQSDFNIQDCFSLFDCRKTAMISRMDFEEVMNLLELYPQVIEIELAMARYDTDGDGKLSYDEFKEALLPQDENYRKLCLARRSFIAGRHYAKTDFFLYETNRELKNCLQLLINTEMRAERIRQSLNKRPNFDIEKAFAAIAGSVTVSDGEAGRPDVLHAQDISKFLVDRNYSPTAAMLNLMFKRLDKHDMKEPKLDDWKREMQPRTSQPV